MSNRQRLSVVRFSAKEFKFLFPFICFAFCAVARGVVGLSDSKMGSSLADVFHACTRSTEAAGKTMRKNFAVLDEES